MALSRCLSVIALLAGASLATAQKAPPLTPPQKNAAEKGSHEKEKTISVRGKDGQTLQTIAVDSDGRVLGHERSVRPSRKAASAIAPLAPRAGRGVR